MLFRLLSSWLLLFPSLPFRFRWLVSRPNASCLFNSPFNVSSQCFAILPFRFQFCLSFRLPIFHGEEKEHAKMRLLALMPYHPRDAIGWCYSCCASSCANPPCRSLPAGKRTSYVFVLNMLFSLFLQSPSRMPSPIYARCYQNCVNAHDRVCRVGGGRERERGTCGSKRRSKKEGGQRCTAGKKGTRLFVFVQLENTYSQ